MYVRYKTVTEVYTLLRRKLCVSCVGTSKDSYYCVIGDNTSNDITGLPLSFSIKKSIKTLSMCFHNVHFEKN